MFVLDSDPRHLLYLDPAALGRAVVERPEDQWFERKSPRIAPRELADALIGLANAEGGVVAVGVYDGRVIGIDGVPARLRNGWRQAAVDFGIPPVPVRMHEAPCQDAEGRDHHLLLIEVEPSRSVHANPRDEVLLRIGDENRRLGFHQRQELAYEKGQASFEASPLPKGAAQALDRALLGSYAERLGHPDPRRLLVARGLAVPNGALTLGGLLLFGANPQARFPEAYVRVLRYQGTERGTGVRQRLLEDVRCEGPIPTVIEGAREAVQRLLPARRGPRLQRHQRLHR